MGHQLPNDEEALKEHFDYVRQQFEIKPFARYLENELLSRGLDLQTASKIVAEVREENRRNKNVLMELLEEHRDFVKQRLTKEFAFPLQVEKELQAKGLDQAAASFIVDAVKKEEGYAVKSRIYHRTEQKSGRKYIIFGLIMMVLGIVSIVGRLITAPIADMPITPLLAIFVGGIILARGLIQYLTLR